MAKLKLTDSEQEAEAYLDWSNNALGELVRYTARILEDRHGARAARMMGAAAVMISEVREAKATETVLTVPYQGCEYEITIQAQARRRRPGDSGERC